MDTVKRITLIETALAREGDGKSSSSPIRIITQYWTQSGELVIQRDPCALQVTPEKMAKLRETVYARMGENEKSMKLNDDIKLLLES